MTGYRNLLKISSAPTSTATTTARRSRLPRRPRRRPRRHRLPRAEIPQLINQGKDKEAYERLGWFVDVFNRDLLHRVAEHNLPELVLVNKVLVPWADTG